MVNDLHQDTWNAAASEVRELCESSGWEINQTQAELAVAALWDRFITDEQRAVIDAATAETSAERSRLAWRQGCGTPKWDVAFALRAAQDHRRSAVDHLTASEAS